MNVSRKDLGFIVFFMNGSEQIYFDTLSMERQAGIHTCVICKRKKAVRKYETVKKGGFVEICMECIGGKD